MIHRFLVAFILTLALTTAAIVASPQTDRAALRLEAAAQKATVEGDLAGAIREYEAIAATYSTTNRPVAAQALLRAAEAYQKLDDARAQAAYQRLVREFGDQAEEAMTARTRLGLAGASATPTGLATQRVLESAGVRDRISPDGRYVARADSRTANLVLLELATGKARALTNDGSPTDEDFRTPLTSVFSRDGRQIAYQWYVGATNSSTLRVVGTAESARPSPRTVYENADLTVVPADWSPDGRWISAIVTRKDRTRQIGVVGVADGALRVLKTVDWSRVGGLRFSPDSSSLAYHRPSRDGAADRDVFIIAVDGSKEAVVAPSGGDDIVLEWTPDGRLLFASDRGGSNAVWSVSTSGGAAGPAELVKSDIGIIASAGPTRDGTLFYNLLPARPGIYTAQFDAASGQLSPASTRPLSQFKGNASFPEFVDEGKALAYISRREVSATGGSGNVLVIHSMDGGQVRELSLPLSWANYPRWFPDGRHVLVYGQDLKGRNGIFKIDANTGDIVLTVPLNTCNLPFVAADGRSFFCDVPDEKQVRQLDAVSGAVLGAWPTASQAYAASPDGRHLVTARLQVVELATGRSRELIRLAPPSTRVGNSFTIDWTPDSRSVVFYGQVGGSEGMWRVPIDGGEPQKLDVSVGPIYSWRFNAKTGQVAFSTNGSGPALEMWKMDGRRP